MTERPILFSAPMVRALLDGSKTQTRRVVKPRDLAWMDEHQGLREPDNAIRCPYGQPGDRLWVRENGWERPDLTQRQLREGADTWPPYEYDAEPLMCWADGELKAYGWNRRPSIHMPRWASRITLEVTDLRVERLQDISEADARAEGVAELPGQAAEPGAWWTADVAAGARLHGRTPETAYRLLWESINGPSSWDANPLVWAISFKRATP